MQEIQKRLGNLGIEVPEILLPRNIAINKWALIACDQYTQDRAYWERAGEAAGSPSSLQLILPEVFLADSDHQKRIDDIHRNMRKFLDEDVFTAAHRGLVYIERATPFNRGRRGLVAAVDLEQYDWLPESRPLIRSTEGTVPERLPPRMEVRKNAAVETQHILLLIDDETDTLLPALGERAKKNPFVYQGDLMLDSGSISGWFLDSEDDLAFFAAGLEKLAGRALTRYGNNPGEHPFLFAAGDGNHSLASAKAVWEEYKAANKIGAGEINKLVHSCRYALVEIENIYDPAVRFEPIHRVVFGLDFDHTLKLLSALPGFSSHLVENRGELVRLTAEPVRGNRFGIVGKNTASGSCFALVETSASGISTACLQPLLDNISADSANFTKNDAAVNDAAVSNAAVSNAAVSIDYIHGEDELFRLAGSGEKPVTGILLPPVQKAGFFETIARTGPLPRKSFSMGESDEKRFYIECRKLFG